MKNIVMMIVSFAATAAFAQNPPQMPSAPDMNAKAAAVAAKAQKGANDASTKASSAMADAKQKALVNLNTASPEDLAKLPGIGPVRAKAIVDGRPYTSISDLKKAKGIKDGVIAKIKNLVTVQ